VTTNSQAVGRRDPEQFDLVIPWEPVDFDELAAQRFVAEPAQAGNGLVGALAPAVAHLPVGFERAGPSSAFRDAAKRPACSSLALPFGCADHYDAAALSGANG
jgi:hypothetical protein